MIMVVTRPLAVRRSVPGGSTSAGRNGRPTRTVTWPPGCGSFWPFGQTPFEPAIAERDDRGAGAQWRGPRRRPAPPGARRRGCACPPGRRTGCCPRRGSAGRAGTPRRRPRRGRPGGRRRWPRSSRRSASRTAPSCRASGSAGRASGISHEPSTIASRFEAWLAARMSGPSRGISSIAPSTVIRLIARPKIRPPNVSVEMSGVIELSIGSRSWPGRRSCAGAARLGSAARRASASRIALTTASTVSSKRLPSVEMIRASAAARSGATARVESSSSRRRSASRMAVGLGAVRVEPALLGPAAGPLLDRRLEEDLEVGVGQHDRPDVAAGHDDPAARRRARAGAPAARGAARGSPTRRRRRHRPPGCGRRRCGRRRRRGRATGGPASSGASSTSSTRPRIACGYEADTLRASASQVTAR